jgi:hypothetical protein
MEAAREAALEIVAARERDRGMAPGSDPGAAAI